MYETIFARSFSKHEQKKMGFGAVVGCLVMAFTLCTVFKPYMIGPLSVGYTGNHFHDFTDVLIPLYLTSRHLNSTVLFLVTDKHSWWTSKYKLILEKLSNYDVVDIDNENGVLCFSRMIIGLKANKEFSVDPTKSPNYSVMDVTKFLRSTYSLNRESINQCHNRRGCKSRRPRLLIVSRKKTRHLTNEGEVAKLARRLGFEVVVKEMGWQVSKVAKFVNTFDAMVGVHGAGLTNMVFLPENAVVIQIIPIGVDLLAKDYFQIPAKDMNLRYLDYKVSLNESSLLGKYSIDSEVIRDPFGVQNKGWHVFRSIYLDNQDVNVDLGRFRKTLLEALKLVHS
ncbi:protein O-GlcNAc transferase [Handroanthus impetiginosus]|uniref:Protein O-GlcNAc transferase n=1 Tax=Handroanthus impetiginosus TaxID=429701 RepID=A0A2G9HK28_9LAMI|nr:protein O-GlcNAc transferase [Handroanthus impetiginosus]